MNLKKVLLFVSIFMIYINTVLAAIVTIEQNYVWLKDWDEIKKINENGDAIISSNLNLEVSRATLNYSNKLTFEFLPWEPNYVKKPFEFEVYVYGDCKSNCTKGEDYFYVKKETGYNWDMKSYNLTINLPNELEDNWFYYNIQINYTLNDFVKHTGSYRMIFFNSYCIDRSLSEGACVKGNFVQTVLLPKTAILESFPEYGVVDETYNNLTSIKTQGDDNRYQIWYRDINEIEWKIPFWWALFGAFMGAFFSYFIGKIIKMSKSILVLMINKIQNKDEKLKGIKKDTFVKIINLIEVFLKYAAYIIAIMWVGGITIELIKTQYYTLIFKEYANISLTLFGFTLIGAIFERRNKSEIVKKLFIISMMFLLSAMSLFFLYSLSYLKLQGIFGEIIYSFFVYLATVVGFGFFIGGFLVLVSTLLRYLKEQLDN